MHYSRRGLLPKQRTELIQWTGKQSFELFTTLNFNRPTTMWGARLKIRELIARVDRHFLGRKWSKIPSEERTLAFASLEHIDTNLHVHMLLRRPAVAKDVDKSEIQAVVEEQWKKLVRSGSQETKLIYDAAGVARYITKEMFKADNYESFMISSQFHNR